MKKLSLIAGALTLISLQASAQTAPVFTEADADGDGALSIEEAETVLPMLVVEDKNADDMLNQSEAETAINGLMFVANGHSGGAALVTESEYQLILQALGLEAES